MKKVLTLLAICLSFVAMSQNGGQYTENTSTRIDLVGMNPNATGQVIVKVTNKQSCTANMRVTYGNETQVKAIAAYSSDTFSVTIPPNGKVRAKTDTNCGFADFGQVELLLPATLPVKFTYFKVEPITNHYFKVTFEVAELSNIDKFVVTVSDDGKTFRSAIVLTPDPLQPNKIYSTYLTIK